MYLSLLVRLHENHPYLVLVTLCFIQMYESLLKITYFETHCDKCVRLVEVCVPVVLCVIV
jgi:hypothetical protein